jgi:parallel beta-helix repeat protein
VTLSIGLLLISSAIFPFQVAAPDILNPVEHSPIIIDGNDEFLLVASENGWSGLGDEDSPFVIYGLSITSDTFGIQISNVDLYFRIEECIIQSSESSTEWTYGILLKNTTHVTVESCIISNQSMGICLWNSYATVVTRTEIYESNWGVFVNESSSVWLHSLDIVMCKVGIGINGSRYTYVDQTIVDNSQYSGIECLKDAGTLLRHNFIVGSSNGVVMAENGNWVIEESIIESCEIGLASFISSGGYLLHSMIKRSSEFGIEISTQCSNITIVRNWFGPENTKNAHDDGEANNWCDDYSQEGNFWEDYSGNGTYLIPGNAESVDRYPTSLEDAPNWEDVVSIDVNNSTSDNSSIGEPIDIPTLTVAVASAFIIVLIAVAMMRSRVGSRIG